VNSSNSYDRLSQVEEQNYAVEIKKSIFFVNSSPDDIVQSIQKALFSCKIKQKITPVALLNFVATREN